MTCRRMSSIDTVEPYSCPPDPNLSPHPWHYSSSAQREGIGRPTVEQLTWPEMGITLCPNILSSAGATLSLRHAGTDQRTELFRVPRSSPMLKAFGSTRVPHSMRISTVHCGLPIELQLVRRPKT